MSPALKPIIQVQKALSLPSAKKSNRWPPEALNAAAKLVEMASWGVLYPASCSALSGFSFQVGPAVNGTCA